MSVNAIVLFDRPQSEIATLIANRLAESISTSIVSGFATPGGIDAIAAPIRARPDSIASVVVGAWTYPGFRAIESLIDAGVPSGRLRVHLGHTCDSDSRKNPVVRFHPMLHSKVYYMEFGNGTACAAIGSHNVTSFALTGLNGEAAVLLEGATAEPEFDKVRRHIRAANEQAVIYSPEMKEAYAWWTREFIDGMRAEVKIPLDWTTVRTILIFATAARSDQPANGDELYFEIPGGIEQIKSLETEAHLFLFDELPHDPWEAIRQSHEAWASYTCVILGADNKRGNREVEANWRIEGTLRPNLTRVPTGVVRPNTPQGMQQARAEIKSSSVDPFDYLFDREATAWDPKYSKEPGLYPVGANKQPIVSDEARSKLIAATGWRLVVGLTRHDGKTKEKDAEALRLAAPESGSFILVALRRRKKEVLRQGGGPT